MSLSLDRHQFAAVRFVNHGTIAELDLMSVVAAAPSSNASPDGYDHLHLLIGGQWAEVEVPWQHFQQSGSGYERELSL